MPHKGPQVALEAWRGVDPARATLELWGGEGGAPGFVKMPEAFQTSVSVLPVVVVTSAGVVSSRP